MTFSPRPSTGASARKISVVIPAYNAGATLAATLDSVLQQLGVEAELVVVDDGSTDRTPEVLAAYAEHGVRSVRQPNAGLAAARRAGLELARGEYVALMDADDLCHPARLALQAAALDGNPDVVLCSTDFSAFDESGPVARSYAQRSYSTLSEPGHSLRDLYPHRRPLVVGQALRDAVDDLPSAIDLSVGDVARQLARGNFVHPPTVMFRRNVLEQVGNFNIAARSMCDWEWLSRAAGAGPFAYLAVPLLDYRLSSTQMSAPRHRIRALSDIVHAAELIRTERRRRAGDTAEDRQLRWQADGYRIDAAEAIAEVDSIAALGMLLRATSSSRLLSSRWFKVLAKIVVPRSLRPSSGQTDLERPL